MTINEKLKNLYEQKWESTFSAFEKIKDKEIQPANPLLIKVNEDKFNNADVRIIIYGKETNGWDGLFKEKESIEDIMDVYYTFTDSTNDFNVHYSGFFWNGVKKFLKILREKFKNKKIYFIYNNVIKIGKSDGKGTPPANIYEIERDYFSVVKDEIDILKPNIVLFLSGVNYDNYIKNIFGEIKYEEVFPFNKNELSKLNIPNVEFAFRTEHPQTLCSWGKEKKDKCLETIIDKIIFE